MATRADDDFRDRSWWVGAPRPVGQALVPGSTVAALVVLGALSVAVAAAVSALWHGAAVGPFDAIPPSPLVAAVLGVCYVLALPLVAVAVKVATMVVVHLAARLVHR